MSTIASFQDVIGLWPGRTALARDLRPFAPGGKTAPVREWHRLNRIPEKWFDAVIAAAWHRGFDEVTYRLLTDIYKAGSAD